MRKITAGQKVKIAVLGSEGRIGKPMADFFRSRGFPVRGADHKTSKHVHEHVEIAHPSSDENRAAVEWADVVIFSILPIQSALMEMMHQAKHSRPDQLWMDMTSVKEAPITEMLASRAEVVGLHPSGVPQGKVWNDITLMAVPARLYAWKEWVEWFLKETGARVKTMTAKEHDRLALMNQVIPHTLLRLLARLLTRTGTGIAQTDMASVMDSATPFSKVMAAQLGRMFKNESELYAGVFFHNPQTDDALEMLADEVQKLRDEFKEKDPRNYHKTFAKDAEYFGPDNVVHCEDRFRRFLKVL